ncbi:MAG: hypothetical protein AAGI69_22645 [Cyanobacteria bacterium P01_H01_bin.21]
MAKTIPKISNARKNSGVQWMFRYISWVTSHKSPVNDTAMYVSKITGFKKLYIID